MRQGAGTISKEDVMIQKVAGRPPGPIVYPDSDGLPMSDNTLQFEWITTIVGGLDALFSDDPNVFVAGDLLWYPIEGDNKTRTAPESFRSTIHLTFKCTQCTICTNGGLYHEISDCLDGALRFHGLSSGRTL